MEEYKESFALAGINNMSPVLSEVPGTQLCSINIWGMNE